MVQNAGSALKNSQNKQREKLEIGVIYLLYGLYFGSSVKCVDAYHAMHIVLM